MELWGLASLGSCGPGTLYSEGLSRVARGASLVVGTPGGHAFSALPWRRPPLGSRVCVHATADAMHVSRGAARRGATGMTRRAPCKAAKERELSEIYSRPSLALLPPFASLVLGSRMGTVRVDELELEAKLVHGPNMWRGGAGAPQPVLWLSWRPSASGGGGAQPLLPLVRARTLRARERDLQRSRERKASFLPPSGMGVVRLPTSPPSIRSLRVITPTTLGHDSTTSRWRSPVSGRGVRSVGSVGGQGGEEC